MVFDIVHGCGKVLEPYLLSEDENLNQVGHKRLHSYIFKFKYCQICMTSSKVFSKNTWQKNPAKKIGRNSFKTVDIMPSLLLPVFWLTLYFETFWIRNELPASVIEEHLLLKIMTMLKTRCTYSICHICCLGFIIFVLHTINLLQSVDNSRLYTIYERLLAVCLCSPCV